MQIVAPSPPFLRMGGGGYASGLQARCRAVLEASLEGVLVSALGVCSQEGRWAVTGTVCGRWIAFKHRAAARADLKQALTHAN